MSRPLVDAAGLVLPFEAKFASTTRMRGRLYAAHGRVTVVRKSEASLAAEVRGGDVYHVELDLRRDALHATCSCPHFADQMQPCKHLWATLLVVGAGRLLPRLDAARSLVFSFDAVRATPGAEHGDVRPPPGWRDVLARAALDVPPAPTRELRYVIDADRTRAAQQLVIRVVERTHARRWGPARVERSPRQSLPPDDRMLLGMLDGASAEAGWYRAERSDFDVPFAASRAILEPVCRSGRAHLDDPEAPPLRWDDAPYSLALEVGPVDGESAWLVRAWLERDGVVAGGGGAPASTGTSRERVGATEPLLIVPGGWAFWSDRVAPLDDAGQFAWIGVERTRGPVALPASELDEFLEAVHRAHAAPLLRLPPGHEVAEARVEGRPFASLRTTRDARAEGGVALEAGMDYDGVRVSLDGHGRAAFDRKGRRLLLRDTAAEEEARAQLQAAGVRPVVLWSPAEDQQSASWRLLAGRLEAAVRELVARGWRVEVDGRVRRSTGDFSIEVTSGIDWLDARVRARFGGVEARLPELLAALRQRRRTVLLADGSEGELSEEAVERLRRWAAMAAPEGDALRFRRVQTALVAALVDGEDERASCDEAFARARAELEGFAGIRALDPPRSLRGSLREYQRYALGWFEALRRFGFGGCLADDMGLGKTVQVLALLDARRNERPRPGPSLVVAPRSVLSNWVSEAARFTPELRVFVHDGPDREEPGDHLRRHDLVLTTYGLLRQDATALSRVEFDYVVLDEAQAIKTGRTATATAARSLRGRHRLALTGTPVENHLGELASLVDFLNPGALGAASALTSLAQGARRAQGASQELLGRAVRPFFLRRTKREVAPELPDRVEQTIACELEGEQRRLYDELHAHYRGSLSRRVARHGVAKSTPYILEALLRLRQAACHPGLIDEARRGDPSAKLDTLLEQLDAVRQQGQKALVFSQFTSLLAIVRDRLDARRVRYQYLDGQTRDRRACIDRFQSDAGCSVFLISLKAGGVGLNLTAAEYVFLLDPWWNPAVEAQAIDRAHRIGQTRTVFAYRLLARGTVEEKVAELQQTKREIAEGLFGEDGAALTGLTRADLEPLLS